MDAYPPQYVEHNLPLVLLSGLGEDQAIDQAEVRSRGNESGTRVHSESPTCLSERSSLLRKSFSALDGTASAWTSKSLPGPSATLRYRIKAFGRVEMAMECVDLLNRC